MAEENGTTETSTTESEETETKAEDSEGAKAEGTEGKEATEEKPAEVPLVDEKFEFELPEKAEVNKDALKEFKNFFIERKMSVETAQAVLNHLLSSQSKAVEIQSQANQKAIDDAVKEIKADPDIGGPNYDKIQAAVDKITVKYGGSDFQKNVQDSELKNDAAFLRFIRNLDFVLSEDKVVTTAQTLGSLDRPMTPTEEAKNFFEKD